MDLHHVNTGNKIHMKYIPNPGRRTVERNIEIKGK